MSLPASYFDELYGQFDDPWGLATRAYEARKYAITLAALPRQRYSRIFEPGCSIGVLTRMLAERGETVVATDVSAAALATARRIGLPANVEASRARVPHDWPPGSFDLVVFSELGYYFESKDLDLFVRKAVASLAAGGNLVAVHWHHPVADYPGNGTDVHRRLRASDLESLAHYEDAYFLLEVFGVDPAARLAGPV